MLPTGKAMGGKNIDEMKIADSEPRLLVYFPLSGFCGRFAELHQSAGQAVTSRRMMPALLQQDLIAVIDDDNDGTDQNERHVADDFSQIFNIAHVFNSLSGSPF